MKNGFGRSEEVSFFLGLFMAIFLTPSVAFGGGGADVRILQTGTDGARARVKLAEGARHELLSSTFNLRNDAIGYAHCASLREAARQGTDVKLLVDGLFFSMNPDLVQTLVESGVQIRVFNPLNRTAFAPVIDKFGILTQRMHGKMMISDGAELIIGGRNLGADYFRPPTDQRDYAWMDLDLYVKGEVVEDARGTFLKLWEKALPPAFSVKNRTTVVGRKIQSDALDRHFRLLRSFGKRSADFSQRLMHVDDIQFLANFGRVSFDGRNTARLVEYLNRSKVSVTIVSPFLYFEPEMLNAIEKAIKERKISVTAYTNADTFRGANLLETAYGSAHYSQRSRLIRMGVDLREVNEREQIHAKSIILDHRLAYVGSSNFSPRSNGLDFESGVIVNDSELANALESEIRGFGGGAVSATALNAKARPFVNRCLQLLMRVGLERTL